MVKLDKDKDQKSTLLTAKSFNSKFRNLILLAWVGPPIVGLSFIFYIKMFTGEQMLAILMAPLEILFVIGSLIFALWYFNQFIQPVVQMLSVNDHSLTDTAMARIRRFPLDFWFIFLVYLLIAPSTVIVSAEWHSNFTALPVDWFRIHLVALIVSIIVGLPIFFLILDLFGKIIGPIGLKKSHVTVKTKVFMIGALMPLLIDTMLVQYYWTRTGFFNYETFMVWLVLEILAIGGSIIFVHSFSQSLHPLQNLSSNKNDINNLNLSSLQPQSTDELGVLITNYRSLIESWQINNQILRINEQILRSTGSTSSLADIINNIITLCDEISDDDIVFLLLKEETSDELVFVAQSGKPYLKAGYCRLKLDENTLPVWIYKQRQSVVINDAEQDERVAGKMCQYVNVKSIIGIPLQVADEIYGVLMTICQKNFHKYSERKSLMFGGISREIAIALQTYQLYQERLTTLEKVKYQAQVIEQFKDSIIATDLNGHITSWNKGAENLFGYPEEFMLNRHISYLYPEEELPTLEHLINTLKMQGTHETEVRMQRKDGSNFFANLSLSMLYNEKEQPVGMIGYSVDITAQKENQELIWHQAHHDKLTGLPNRWLLQDRINQNINIAHREKHQSALMFLDLDSFKKINDTLGHEFGDEILLVISNRLSELVREGDTLARLGGDEFVMLLSRLHDIHEASDVAERILFEIKQPVQVRGRDVRLGGSIGIAGYPVHGSDSDTLLKHADFAMYYAKERGGNNYQFYTAEIHQQASTRYQMEYELHHAIENNDLEVNYQPQYNIATGKIVGLEALCRWHSRKFGQVSPEEFISIVEETGLIVTLGNKIINLVVDDMVAWKKAGIKPPKIAINLSAKQIYSEETLIVTKQALKDNDLSGNMLEFEITESSLMDNPQLAEAKINAIKELGISIAIDDFGTGYSSLAYLKRFPVDILKIDRSFISDLVDDLDDREIVETIIGMAKNLGLQVVAEGIEEKEQADFLLQRGCHIGQGYYYSKPMSTNECKDLLNAGLNFIQNQ